MKKNLKQEKIARNVNIITLVILMVVTFYQMYAILISLEEIPKTKIIYDLLKIITLIIALGISAKILIPQQTIIHSRNPKYKYVDFDKEGEIIRRNCRKHINILYPLKCFFLMIYIIMNDIKIEKIILYIFEKISKLFGIKTVFFVFLKF